MDRGGTGQGKIEVNGLYQYSDRVSYSRVDKEGRLKVYAIVNALQDCCMFHGEEVGRSCLRLKDNARAWLVSSWHIVCKKRPHMGEEFVIKTWPYKFRGVFGNRNFVMETKEGEPLVCADSVWFYFDQAAGKPVRPAAEDVEPFGMGEPYPMEYKPRKVRVPEKMEYRASMTVCENHMDTNSHMNNGEYVRIAADYLPRGFETEELLVEYRLAARLGDEICIYTKEEADGFYVVMTDENKNPYAIHCFQKGRVD